MVYVFYTYMNRKAKHSYNGGGNYSLRILKILAENKRRFNICIPKGYKPVSESERELFENSYIKIIEFDDNYEFEYDKVGELWFPNLSPLHYNLLKRYRNKGFKVYITIHGTRNLNLKMDKYDRYYYKGIRYWMFPFCESVYILIYRILFLFILNKYLKYCDKVFTVSNHSLVEITKRFKTNYIQVYYQGIIQKKPSNCANVVEEGKYMLFVSGDRREKNFLRTLIAYLRYVEETDTDIKLVVTGIDNEKKENILRCRKLDKRVLEKYVKFYGYVSNEELDCLYSNCEFLLYTSKNEGFGIPMLEALHFEKRVLAAYGSAIPETVGALAVYVNPYSEESIYRGMKKMSSESKKYSEQMKQFKNIVDEKIRINDQLFADEFSQWE